MKTTKVAILVLLIAVALFIVLPNLSWAADDAAATFKAKCASCHGADGGANTAVGKKMNIPEFASDKVQKKSDADLVDFIANGGKEKKASHAFANKGVTPELAKELVAYVRVLGKKK